MSISVTSNPLKMQGHAFLPSMMEETRDIDSFMTPHTSMAGRFQAFMKDASHTPPKGVRPLNTPKDMTYAQALDASKEVFKNFYQNILKMIFTEIKRGENEENNAYQSHMVGDLFVERLSEVLGHHVTPDHERMATSMMQLNAQKHTANQEDV